MNPTFEYEQKLWNKGIKFVAGADEVGRGAFAGPVVASAVAFAPISNLQFSIFKQNQIIVRDSKKMSSRQREEAAIWIKDNCLSWGIGMGSVTEINRYGIVRATNKAYRRAIGNCKIGIENLLVDAFYVPYVSGIKKKNQTPIVKGDNLSISIAAASIIAKVYRDSLMKNLSKQFVNYKWETNAGYGTLAHRNAIQKFGKTRHHRSLWIKPSLFQG